MSENEDFIVDKNGILLDCPPGSLLLDENGIVQDTDHSSLQLPADYEDTPLSLYDSQPYQRFLRSNQVDEQSWYCISDLEVTDDEKDVPGTVETFTTKSVYGGRQHSYQGQPEISKVTSGSQILDYDYNQVISGHLRNEAAYSPLNNETSHKLSHYVYNDKDPLEVFMNQPNYYPHNNSNNNNNNGGGIASYQAPVPTGIANPMYFYQNRDLLAVSESSSKSSITIPEGLTASERDLYLHHANASQTLDSSHSESYRLHEGHQVQDDDDDDDELFLITGHIDFDAHRSSRPGSANVWKHSSGLDQETAKRSEENSSKSRIEKRSVSFDTLPQEQSFNPNEEVASSFARDSSGNIQSNNAPFTPKKSQGRYWETGRFHPALDPNFSEQHLEQLRKMNKGSNSSFLNPDISFNSGSNFASGNIPVRNEHFEQSFSQYFSDESFQIPEDQKMQILNPENPSGESAVNRKVKRTEKHHHECPTPMNDSKNFSPDEMEEESLSKSKTGDSVKSFRAKSKSTTNICSPSTPVKSKYKSLSELSNIPTDGDDETSNLKLSFSIKDLNARLEEELSKRKKATELVEQLQNRYDNLLTRYADAENMIDELRIGSKMAPKVSDFKSSQSPVTNLLMNRALITSTPMASTFSMNQSLRDDDDRLLHNGNFILNNAERNTKTNNKNDQPPSKSEKIKADLILQANHLESKINTLVNLLEKRQLTAKELKKVFDNIRSEQDKQRREYLRVKEEFQIIGANSEDVFDKDKELEGYLFQLQMRFDELEDKHKHLQENQKEPFQETENQENQTDAAPKMVAEFQDDDNETEKKRQKFLSQYNSLMDRYQRLKTSGSLNENDEEVKEIKKKLQVISEELCLSDQQQRPTMRRPDSDSKMIRGSPKVKNQFSAQFSGQNVRLLEGIHKTNTTIDNPAQQKTISSQLKNSDKKSSRIVRSLPAPPKESGEPTNKKSDEVSSTTSVPDSGIFEELNGTSHRHPSVTNKMRIASSRGQRVQSLVPVNAESSDGPATNNNSPRVLVTHNRRWNSLGLAEVSSQSTEATSLNSQIHGDDSFLWQPTMTTLHNLLPNHGRSTESEPIEYSSENSDQTDLDTSERRVSIRKARPKSILRRKYKPSKIRPSSSEKLDQNCERVKPKNLSAGSGSEQRERSRSNLSNVEKTESKKTRRRSLSLDSHKTKSNEQPSVIKSSNKEKLKSLQLEIESLKERFNNGIPWKNARVKSNTKSEVCLGEISSAATNLHSYPNPIYSSSSNVHQNSFPQELQYQTTVRSSLEEVHWKDPSPGSSYRGIHNFNSIDASNSSRVNNTNPIRTSSEAPTMYKVQKDQNSSLTILDYHSPMSHKKAFQKPPPQKSPVSSRPEHRSNSFYLSNPNNREFLPSARSVQDISQRQTDHSLPGSHLDQRQYYILNRPLDYHDSINSLAPEPVWSPHHDQLKDVSCLKGQPVLNPPHHNQNSYRVPVGPLHSNTVQRQSIYTPSPPPLIPNVVKKSPALQHSRSCTPIPHSVTPICDICGRPGCSHNYVTEVNYTYPAQGTVPIPTPPYSVYNQNLPSQQRIPSNYRNYQSADEDLNDSINIAERTIEDINHLTKKMMKTMQVELIKSKRNTDFFYPF